MLAEYVWVERRLPVAGSLPSSGQEKAPFEAYKLDDQLQAIRDPKDPVLSARYGCIAIFAK